MKENDLKNAKDFSLIFGLGIIILSLLFFIKKYFGLKYFIKKFFLITPLWFKIIIILGLIIIVIGKILPDILIPISKLWIKFGESLSFINIIFLGIIYYLVFTPVAIFFKLKKTNLLDKDIDKNIDSYWIKKEKESDIIKQY